MRWKTKAAIGRAAGGAVVALILLFVMAPSLVVAVVAFTDGETLTFPPSGLSLRWFERAFTYADFQRGAWNSLVVATLTSVVATLVGTFYVFAVSRYRFTGRNALTVGMMAPLIIPHFILGLAFLMLASQIGMTGTWSVLVVTHVIAVVPFVVRSVHVSFAALDPALERAAAGLGAPPSTVFWRIVVPLLAPGVLGGWLFAFILSFTEFSASLFVTSQTTQTLPVAMYTYIRDFADPTMAALSTVFIAVTAVALTAAVRWLGLADILSAHYDR